MKLIDNYKTGSYEPRALNNGRKPRLNEETLERVRKRIEEQPDITLQELIEELTLPVSAPALCQTIKQKLGLVRKKNGTHAQEQHRQDVTKQRKEWKSKQPTLQQLQE